MLSTVLSTIVVLSILGNEDSLFSLNVSNSYPDLIISENTDTIDGEDVGFNDVLSFMGILPKDEFGEIAYTSVVKTRMNVNSGSSKSNLDIYGIEQEGLESIIPAFKNVQNIENIGDDEDSSDMVQYGIIDSVNASPREVAVGSDLAKSLGVIAGDELIISTTGENFIYYAELFNVKFVVDTGNPDFDNSIIMSRDYIDSIAHPDDISIMYFSIGNKDKSDQLKNILLENYPQGIEVSSRNDYVNGYDLYRDIFDIVPTIYALMFCSMLLFFYSMNINRRFLWLRDIKSKLSSKPLLFVVYTTEVILSVLFYIITLPILELWLKSMYHSGYSVYRLPIALISITSIVIITAISYLLCSFVKIKN